MDKLTNIIESLLFVSGKEISIDDISEKLQVSKYEVNLAILELQKIYTGECGLHLLSFNDKVQFGSNPDYGEAVETVLNPIRERELSRSMLETAAIIAYKQPVTRAELEELRGNSDYAISNLVKLGVIEIVGRKDAVGRPFLYGTTDKFLKRFQISSLEDLPDYDELMAQVKVLNSPVNDNYLYRKDEYVDNGEEDVMPPQRQFVPKKAPEDAAISDADNIADISEEEVPDFMKGEEVELFNAEEKAEDDHEEDDSDYDDDADDYYDEEESEEDEDSEFDKYSIDDEKYEDEEEEEDSSDYSDDDEADDGYDEDDK